MKNKIALVGYSGHAYIVYETLVNSKYNIAGYFDLEEKEFNPFEIPYLGTTESMEFYDKIGKYDYFIAIGDNRIRRKIQENIIERTSYKPLIVIHEESHLSDYIDLGSGVYIGVGARVNTFAKIKRGVIINTGVIVEHEVVIEKYSHIAPGAIISAKVHIGEECFIGAGAVIRQGIKIGNKVTIGPGTVILEDVPDGQVIFDKN